MSKGRNYLCITFFPKVKTKTHLLMICLPFILFSVETSDIMNYGASAHSDYGMITILATDGVRGLQACSIKKKIK